MQLNDPLGLLAERTLVGLCRLADRPLPVEARLESGRGPLAVYVLRGSDGTESELLLELTTSARGSGLAIARAAQGLLPLADRVPQPPPLSLIDTGPAGGRAAFRPRVGRPASAVLVNAPDRWPEVAKALGDTLDGLPDVPATHFGLGVYGTRLVPERASWAAQWEAWCAACAVRAEGLGAGIGELGRRLLDGVRDRLDALEDGPWQLVHGGLGTEAVALGNRGATVDLWHQALLGDGLVDLGPLLALEPALLASVLAHVDPARVDHWRSGAVRRKLEAYHLGWCLAQLDQVGAQLGFDRNLGRLQRLGAVVAHGRRALEPGFVEGRLAAVAPAAVWTAVEADPVRAKLRVPLGWLGAAGLPEAPKTLARVLGALLLADGLEGPARARALELGWSERALVRHGPSADRAEVVDREAWRSALVDLALDAGGDAVVLAWLGLAAVDRVGDSVPAETLRGLERLVRAVATAPEPPPPPGASRLWHGVVRLAARAALGEAVDSGPVVELGLDLDPVGAQPTQEGSADAVLAGLDGGDGDDRARPLLILALRALVGRVALPGGPDWILNHARP